ncbi:MAG: prolipoprotein diacylglyceryl transferase [Candidatus Shapirobacteria bacterium]|nr:prolipoprotein diacylglyceryl transferase [Candidatus Shapirobacteria bacterium]
MSLGIIRIVASVVFLYLLWRNLRQSYDDQKIITYSWLALLGFLIFGRLVYGLINWGIWNNDLSDWLMVWNKPGMSYMGGYLGVLLVSWLYSRSQQWKFLNFTEDLVKPLLVLIGLMMVDEWVRAKFSWQVLIYILMIILVYMIANWLAGRYRSFVWYKSGKKGFVLLASNFLFFLVLAFVFGVFKDSLVNLILASIISLISVVGLFILGGVKYERK